MTSDAAPDPVAAALAAYAAGEVPDREVERAAVRATLDALVAAAPGRSVEVRIPPYAAVQAVAGTTHRRGTPPATVEADARTWIEVATGRLDWAAAVASGRVRASGQRSDLSGFLPVRRVDHG